MSQPAEMQYRILPHGGEKISVIGMGSAAIGERSEKIIEETVQLAVERGINCFDMAGSHGRIFSAYGRALKGRRREVMFQVHFGADYSAGEYGWNQELDAVKASVAWQLKCLQTDYIDFGFIHCLDELTDLDSFLSNGILDYISGLKSDGVIRHIGLSTHSPAIAERILDMGIADLDMLMFSINPMYDYGQGNYAIGSGNERFRLYQRCEKEGIGISVMKPFSAGLLLDASKSPFHQALTTHQCIQYALDRPGVLTVMQGAGSPAELLKNLAYLEASPEERDYAAISAFAPGDTHGICVYCRHCHPCPAGLDIGLINKYFDLARLGDPLAREHYMSLGKTARDCIQCGRCASRCPFKVAQPERMAEIQSFFGR